MISKLKYFAAAAALAIAPVAGSAATELFGGESVDVLADSYFFDGTYDVGDLGDTLTFTFTNSSSQTAAITLFGTTVLQSSAEFTDGVEIDFGPLSYDVAQGDGMITSDTFTIAANSSAMLTIQFGTVVDAGIAPGGQADIDFTVEAALVPVPAAGLLLLTALGGAFAMRRRKTAA